MTAQERAKYQYRFKGYLPPLISLGGNTDPGYWCKFYTHPYYVNQPQYWKQPYYRANTVGPVGVVMGEDSINPPNNGLYAQLPIC